MTQRIPLTAGLAAIALVLAGCDSSQPATSPVQTATVTFRATAQVNTYACWEVWTDSDGDNLPDQPQYNQQTGQVLVQCDRLPDPAQKAVPWFYTVALTVIRAGQTQEQLIATSLIPGDPIEDFANLTPYDTTSDTGGTKAPEGTTYYITPGGPPTSGSARVVGNGSQLWLEANGFFLGDPNIMLQPEFNVDLNQGDTLIVRARKQALSDSPQWLPEDTGQQVELVGVVTVGGVPVPLDGISTSPTQDKTGVTFSFTRR